MRRNADVDDLNQDALPELDYTSRDLFGAMSEEIKDGFDQLKRTLQSQRQRFVADMSESVDNVDEALKGVSDGGSSADNIGEQAEKIRHVVGEMQRAVMRKEEELDQLRDELLDGITDSADAVEHRIDVASEMAEGLEK